MPSEKIDTIVIGGGQAGLATGYYLSQRRIPFLILEAKSRIGDTWRERWDDLRLFTPACFDGIVGMPFPAKRFDFPTKDEMGNYLENYVSRFKLPVRTGTRVIRLSRSSDGYHLETTKGNFVVENVVIAMATFQRPKLPTFASEISGAIRQLHSSEYKRPSQLNPGSALVVGAGNSGAEIALELARAGFQVTLSGRDVGQVPFKVDGLAAKMGLSQIVLRGVFHRLLTVDTPMGRKVRPKLLQHGGPLIRVKSAQLQQAGVVRAGRVEGVRNGLPYLSDGTALEVDNIIWCTGFEPGMSWIDLPVFDHAGEPAHSKGIVENSPGLYFVGLHFLYALSSTMIHGVSRDAKRIVSHLAAKRTSSVADTVV